jgi:hypothetical protein
VVVLDLAPSAICGAPHSGGMVRSALLIGGGDPSDFEAPNAYVLTSPDGIAARFAWAEASKLTSKPVYVLDGGTDAWAASGEPTNISPPNMPRGQSTEYKRPYEGTDASATRCRPISIGSTDLLNN